jgi:hypothetical protein
MKNIKNWIHFNESNYDNNQILSDIIEKIGLDNLSNINFGEGLIPYVSFIYNNILFSISLTDKNLNNNYKTIYVIIEKNSITETIGVFNIDEIDDVVDLILNY